MKNTFRIQGATCCIDYCEKLFVSDVAVALNRYRCGGTPITAERVWRMRRRQKATRFAGSITPVV